MALKVGEKVPFFESIDQNGNHFDSRTILGIKPVVFYFYPKDNTLGCTAQACEFRDKYEDFRGLGVDVIGISDDDFNSHQNFVKQYNLPFLLLSDSDQKIKNLFGVTKVFFGLLKNRITFVVDKEGIIQMVYDGLFPKKHISKVLELISK